MTPPLQNIPTTRKVISEINRQNGATFLKFFLIKFLHKYIIHIRKTNRNTIELAKKILKRKQKQGNKIRKAQLPTYVIHP